MFADGGEVRLLLRCSGCSMCIDASHLSKPLSMVANDTLVSLNLEIRSVDELMSIISLNDMVGAPVTRGEGVDVGIGDTGDGEDGISVSARAGWDSGGGVEIRLEVVFARFFSSARESLASSLEFMPASSFEGPVGETMLVNGGGAI